MENKMIAIIEGESLPAVIEARPLEINPAAVYLSSLPSPGSRRTMRGALDTVAAILTGGKHDALSCPWETVRFQHTAAVRTRLAECYAPATANCILSALRGVLEAAWRLGQISAEDWLKASRVKAIKGSTLPAGRHLSFGEIEALLTACCNDDGPAGARDAAIIGVMYPGGLRRAEVVGLDRVDYSAEAEDLPELKVRRGKGRKDRMIYLNGGSKEYMADWLAIRGDDPGPLFWPVNKGGRLIRGQRLSTQAIYNMLRKRIARAGIASCTPHDLRRTVGGDMLDAGADLSIVASWLGHASVETTRRSYDRRGERAKKKAIQLIHLPYRGRRQL